MAKQGGVNDELLSTKCLLSTTSEVCHGARLFWRMPANVKSSTRACHGVTSQLMRSLRAPQIPSLFWKEEKSYCECGCHPGEGCELALMNGGCQQTQGRGALNTCGLLKFSERLTLEPGTGLSVKIL
jgi:hypothetical protein